MRTLRRSAAAVFVLLAGCGTGGSSSPPASSSTTLVEGASDAEPTFIVEATVTGSFSATMRHVVRVERPDGTQVFERALDATLRTTEGLAPGKYRVLSFQRPCIGDSCGPTAPAVNFGAPVDDPCGAYFTVEAEAATTARFEIVAGEGCSVTLS